MRRNFIALRVHLLRLVIRVFGKTRINPGSFLAGGVRPLQYSLDGFDGLRLYGWVRCDLEPKARIDVEIYVNQDFYGQFPACRFRADIAAAHGTDGYHGFDIPIHGSASDIRSVHAVIPGYFLKDIGGVEGTWAGGGEEGQGGFKSPLVADSSEPLLRPTEHLTAESQLPDKLVLTRRSISAYVDHVRFVYRKERDFPVHVSDNAYRDYLRWYLDSEIRTGKPPYLGPRELSYLNAESDIAALPGLPLSNATKLFLAEYKSAFPDERDPIRQAENLLYWWCVLKLGELNVCGLIPESYIAFLSEKPGANRDETRFLNAFARHNFRDFPIEMHRPGERRLLMDRLLQVAGKVPQLRPLLPQDVLIPPSHATPQDLAKHNDSPAKPLTPSSGTTPSVRLFGPLKKLSGLGEASRLSHALLSKNGLLCETQDVSGAFPSRDLDISLPSDAAAIATINLFHLNAEMIPDAARRFPEQMASAYNIAYCFWELDKPATAHLLGYELLDEVWVSSDFGKDALAGHIQARVTKVGLPCRKVFPSREAGRSILAALGVSDQTFRFICSFDALSYVQRKNPIGTIRAFQDAFASGEDVALIVKTHSRHRAHDAFQDRLWEGIVEACESDERIYLVDKDLEQDALDSLTANCDCLVSLHRAEAWGFGMIDAMSLGVPVIATAYSGNLEFCNPETAMLVDYDLVPVMDSDYAFAIPGARWAEPKQESAVRALRSVFGEEAARRRLQSQAKSFVETHFSFEAIGEKYRRRLREIHEAKGCS